MAIQVERPRRLFTADEYERMVEVGVFRPEERIELIRGEIVVMSPIGPGHGACVASLTKRFVIGVGDRAVVRRTRGPRTSCWSSRSPRPRCATTGP